MRMDIFEYLPQLIVAYDGNDEFANLIHVKKADKEKDYLCPCCGGIVKPRALNSSKEQSHYYHQTGKCTKESQLHFFCKNWLFEEGSKFYVNEELFEVASVDIEKTYHTSFGDYKPDVTVHTTNDRTIYFEIFFTNRKTGDDYFCKWDELRNDVVEVNIKEYMFKTDIAAIPSFSYLYHDGTCYSKPYIKRDLYANTIARIKRELTRQKVLNYKARIEQLDWFWQSIRNNSRESILEIVSKMKYEDMISCYEIIKRKQCVTYLKNDILEIINQKVVSDVRKVLDLPYDENVYFDLKHIRGRTYEAGIRLNIKTNHITYNDIWKNHYCRYYRDFDKLDSYPKIVFKRNIFNPEEIYIPDDEIKELQNIFDETIRYKKKLLDYENCITNFEGDNYKIRMNNNTYTVLTKIHTDNFEVLFDDFYQKSLDINVLSEEIECRKKEIKVKEYIDKISNDEKYLAAISELQNRKNLDCKIDIRCSYLSLSEIHFKLYFRNKILYDEILQPTFKDFEVKINECKNIIDNLFETHSIITKNLAEKINTCKNNFWKAELLFDNYGNPEIIIDQKLFKVRKSYLSTSEKVCFNDNIIEEHEIYKRIKNAMYLIFKNMERCGYRVMEV